MPSSMFNNNHHIDIYGGVFTMDIHMKEDFERLRPSHKADYRTVLGELALKREECTAGTRVKILEDISKWANNRSSQSPSVFWLTGQAGSGKTTIAYTITKRFGRNGNADLRHTVLGGSFLCSRQFEETRQETRIVPTIAYQLARKCKSYAGALHNAQNFDAVHHDVPTQLKDLLVGPWQQSTCDRQLLPPYLIVIDALDEIKDGGGSAFLQELLTIINECDLRGFKFLVTSRPDPKVVTLCKSFTSEAVCWLQDVPIEEAELDIKTYLKAKLPMLASSLELADLVRQADGLFIYAATAVKYLIPHHSITIREQTKMLKLLVSKSYKPASANDVTFLIDALYRQIMVDAFSKFKDEFLICRLRILYTFLCTAERTSPSMAASLVAEGDDDVAMAVVKELHAVLYTQGDRVFWYHASFPDFIFDPTRSNFDNLAFWCNEAAHHKLLGESCFHVMKSGLRFNMGGIHSSFLFDSDDELLAQKVNTNIDAVLRYSTCHWTHHLPIPQLANTDSLRFCISEFLQIRVLFWIEAMNLLKLRNQCTPMLQHAREWVLKCGNNYSKLARDIHVATNFATYFTGSPAAESTPHLYISTLATWSQDADLCRNWKNQFSRIPVYTHTKGRIDVPLMTISTLVPTTAVAFSSDGLRIVSGSGDQTVRIWDASTGAGMNVLEGHTNSVSSVAISRDGMRIVSGSDDMTVRIWDASTGAGMNVLEGHTNSVSSVAISRDGMRIVSGSDDMTVRIWDASTGIELNVLMGHTMLVTSVAISRDGMRIVSGSGDKTARIWDASTGAKLNILKGPTDWIESVAISKDGIRIVSGSRDRTVRMWDATTGAELNVLEGHTNTVTSVSISRDGMQIVSGSSDMTVRIWDASTGVELNVLEGHTMLVTSVAISGDGLRIVSGSGDKTVRIWDVLTGAELNMLEGHTNWVASVATSRDGMRIVSGSDDRTVRIWDSSTGGKLNMLMGHTDLVTSVAISSDGMRVVSGSGDMTVRIWDALTGAELNVLEGHTDWVASVAISRDGMRIVSSSYDMTMRIWDVSTGAELNILKCPTDWVESVAISRDGVRIVSGSRDHTVRVWDATTGAELNILMGHTDGTKSVAISSDGMRIVSGSGDKTVRIWDASTGAELNVLEGHTDWVMSVAISKDGMRIVSGSYDETVWIWDAFTGTELNVLRGHTNTVSSVSISRDGKRIVSGSYDKTVRVWDAFTGAVLDVLRGHTGSVYSVAFSKDDISIVSGSADESVRMWDTWMGAELQVPTDQTDTVHSVLCPRQWHLAQTNWIVSSQGNRLMWVPQEAQVVEPSVTLVISRRGFGSVDFRQAMMGVEWIGCYTP